MGMWDIISVTTPFHTEDEENWECKDLWDRILDSFWIWTRNLCTLPCIRALDIELSTLPTYLQLEEQASKTVLSICTGPFNPTPTDIFIRVTPASTQHRDQYLGIETQISLLRRVDKGLRKRARPGRTPTTRDQGTLHSSALVDTPARHLKENVEVAIGNKGWFGPINSHCVDPIQLDDQLREASHWLRGWSSLAALWIFS
jgi:hypothetical protein